MAFHVLEIHRMAVHNGPGIRTMVHFMGCPLRCIWCSTPESQSTHPVLYHETSRCIGCGKCVRVCPQGAISIEGGISAVDREKCDACMKCVDACYTLSLQSSGIYMDKMELFREIIKDKDFFETSGGGVTFSGGEPMMSYGEEFLDLLRMLKQEGISIGIDTCGYAASENYAAVAEYTDFFLWDLKQMNPQLHKQYTGVDNTLIIRNLKQVDQAGRDTYLRCPVIPGYTDDEANLEKICLLAKELQHVKEVHIIAFHHLGTARYDNHGYTDPTEDLELLDDEILRQKLSFVESMGLKGKIIQ